jgi:hypothetical protein
MIDDEWSMQVEEEMVGDDRAARSGMVARITRDNK